MGHPAYGVAHYGVVVDITQVMYVVPMLPALAEPLDAIDPLVRLNTDMREKLGRNFKCSCDLMGHEREVTHPLHVMSRVACHFFIFMWCHGSRAVNLKLYMVVMSRKCHGILWYAISHM